MTADHIVSFVQHLDGGGVERALLRLAGGWAAAGRRVTILVGDDGGPLAAGWPAGVARVTLGTRSRMALARAVRRTPGDLILCPGNHYSGVAALARLLGERRPIVAKLSNALDRPDHGGVVRWGYRRWLRLHPRFLDRLVALSPGLADEAAHRTGVARSAIAVIPNPPAQRDPDAPPVAVPPGRFLLGVGRLVPQKRWERLIAALPDLPGDVALTILGEGPERARLEAVIARLGLADRVRLPGHAADPLPAMALARAVVLTSDFEGSPGVLAEALGVGTPVVATDSSAAIRELVPSRAHGRVVPVGDPAALVAALGAMLDAPRPLPLAATGDPVAAYLAVFDALVSRA